MPLAWVLSTVLALQQPSKTAATPDSVPAPACLSVSRRQVATPRKLHDAKPKWADMANISTPLVPLIYDATIDPTGTVTRVKAVHVRGRKRPDPKLETLWADAIRKWAFEPTIVDGRPMPVCMTVTVNIDPQ
jgi:protein TonB